MLGLACPKAKLLFALAALAGPQSTREATQHKQADRFLLVRVKVDNSGIQSLLQSHYWIDLHSLACGLFDANTETFWPSQVLP